MRRIGVSLGLLLLGLGCLAAAQDKTRNPFGVRDVTDPDAQEVQDFAATVKLAGDAKDANAEQWVKEATDGKKGSLDGDWSGRWKSGDGEWVYNKDAAKVKQVGDRTYVLFKDGTGTYLIDAKRVKNRLIGKWQNLENADDAGPCVFLVVDDERLDGDWGDGGRWDFRRKLR